ncbi:hypothetical protein FACS189413_00490 [Bacteroidia bacterium]|nr:hypothetical protein FACS189463_0130 [Bacteroidia bacterium]GHU66819.1 hypothetical protein FACS189413_00490 [Bacteroidia bacterium]
MKISIIIPIYNVEQYIERCLLSALNQSYSNIEYILVDDASPDNSMEIAATLLENHPRREAVKTARHSGNRGLSAARNTGVKAATGDYLFFMDSDDALPPDSLEILAALVQNQTVDFVIGEIQVIGNKRNAYPLLLLKDGFYQGNSLIFNAFLNKQWYEMAWNKLIRREFFMEKQLWFEEGILHEDNLWSFQLAITAETMAVSHSQTYIYHIQGNSITQKKSKKNIENFYFVLEKIINWSIAENVFNRHPAISSYLEQSRIYFLKSLIKNNFDGDFIQKQKSGINNLYKTAVWKGNNRKIEFVVKDFILFLWGRFKNTNMQGEGNQLSDYKIEIVTRSMNRKLYHLSQSTIQLPFKRIRLTNTTAESYLYQLLKRDVDYVINIDEDAFIYNNERLLALLNYCIANDIDLCGMPDGGVLPVRQQNPLVVNPFFNIIHVKKLRSAFSKKAIRKYKEHQPEYEQKTPVHLLKTNYTYRYCEPFEPFFVWISQNFKVLYLNAEEHTDGFTTLLKDPNDQPFLLHTWFSRMYETDDFHTQRINNILLTCAPSALEEYTQKYNSKKELCLQKMESFWWFYFWKKYHVIADFIRHR